MPASRKRKISVTPRNKTSERSIVRFISSLPFLSTAHDSFKKRQRYLFTEAVVFALFVVAVLAFFYRVLILDTASIPHDIQEWHYPQLAFLGNALIRGEFPLWNPHIYGGMPFIGEINAALFYPINIITLWIGGKLYGSIPYRLIEYELAAHYVLAGWGAYWLARTFRVSRPAAVLAGTIYMFGPYLASQAQHLGLVLGAAWVPFVLLAVRRTIERPGLRWPTFLALLLSISIFTGFFPAIMSLALVLIVVYTWAICRSGLSGKEGRTLAFRILLRAAWAAGLTLCMTAVQLLPFVELGLASVATDRAWGKVIGPSFKTAITMFVPNFFNVQKAANYWSVADGTQEHFYLAPMILALSAIALAATRARAVWWLLAATIAALVFASDLAGLALPLIDLLPRTLSGSFELYTLRLYSDLALGLLAAIGFDQVATASGHKRGRIILVGSGVLVAIGALLLVVIIRASNWRSAAAGIEPKNWRDIENASAMLSSANGALVWLAVTMAALVALVLIRRTHARMFSHGAIIATIGLAIVPLFVHGSNQPFNSDAVSSDFKLGPTYTIGRQTGVVAFLQYWQRETGPFRIDCSAGMGWRWATSTQLWGLENINGDDPLLPADTYDFLSFVYKNNRDNRLFFSPDFNSPLLNLLNVRYVVATTPDRVLDNLRPIDPDAPLDQYKLVFSDWYKVFENRSTLPRALIVPNAQYLPDRKTILQALASSAYDPREYVFFEGPLKTIYKPASEQSTVTYQAIGANRVQVNVKGSSGGFLLVFDHYWPGWVATMDGIATEIKRADFLFRAVELPPGDHIIDMEYKPASFRIGLCITLVTMFALVVLPLFRRVQQRNKAQPGS